VTFSENPNFNLVHCVAISAAMPLKQLKMILEMKRRNSPAFVAAKATELL
jgi:hypothetical protein